MKLVSKKEREANALSFYRRIKAGACKSAALVAVHYEIRKTNMKITQFQFTSTLPETTEPIVVSESLNGIEGCFYEFLSSINRDVGQKSYFDEDFNVWLARFYGIRISYNDGTVFLFERARN